MVFQDQLLLYTQYINNEEAMLKEQIYREKIDQ